mmetsp:Transcript_19034/g.62041  ORF Transcript_19034/g.62041 Transcript_19034/m.62041 type:complete len:258 (+) Transcript_19034:700-1473(+)
MSSMLDRRRLAALFSSLSHAKKASVAALRSKPMATSRSIASLSSCVTWMTCWPGGAPPSPPPPPAPAGMPIACSVASACSSSGSLISRRNSCWLLLICSSSCGFCLPSSWSIGWRTPGLACTMPRSAWNCGLLRRKSRLEAPPSPAAAGAGCWKRLKGWELGPAGGPAAAAAAGGAGAAPPPVAGGAPPAVGGAAAGAGGSAPSGMPVIKYSTARSGLLNAARRAFTTCSRSKPISMMDEMVLSSWDDATRLDAALW